MNAIEARGLTKKYRDKLAVDSLELTVGEGELFAMLGVNGAGKTTAIRMLSCLAKPTAGDALVFGNSIVSRPRQVKRLINVSPQETAVAPGLTARENLELIAGIYGAEREDALRRARESLADFGLEDCADRRARVLSGGQQRRLSIAMALISGPRLLFLDEPTLGLDVLARRELWSAIEKLKGKMTVILTTHYLEEAEALSDRIAIMERGRLRAVGTAAELMELAGKDAFEDAFIALAAEGGVNG